MTTYITRRVLSVIPVIILISFMSFVFVRMIPGDPVTVMLGERARPDDIVQYKAQMGLDQPLQGGVVLEPDADRESLREKDLRRDAVHVPRVPEAGPEMTEIRRFFIPTHNELAAVPCINRPHQLRSGGDESGLAELGA